MNSLRKLASSCLQSRKCTLPRSGIRSFASSSSSTSNDEPKKTRAKKSDESKSSASSAPEQQRRDGPDPKDGMAYKNPEFFEYNKYSFNDVMIDTTKFHLPKPSALQ